MRNELKSVFLAMPLPAVIRHSTVLLTGIILCMMCSCSIGYSGAGSVYWNDPEMQPDVYGLGAKDEQMHSYRESGTGGMPNLGGGGCGCK